MAYTRTTPRHRRALQGFGDGPVTSPGDGPGGPVTSPNDPSLNTVIGTVPPTVVSCDQLPSDSPWRGPGGPCPPVRTIFDWFHDLFAGLPASPTPGTTPGTTPATTESSVPTLALLAGVGGIAYYLVTKKKRSA